MVVGVMDSILAIIVIGLRDLVHYLLKLITSKILSTWLSEIFNKFLYVVFKCNKWTWIVALSGVSDGWIVSYVTKLILNSCIQGRTIHHVNIVDHRFGIQSDNKTGESTDKNNSTSHFLQFLSLRQYLQDSKARSRKHVNHRVKNLMN